jgi:hypothetical protein
MVGIFYPCIDARMAGLPNASGNALQKFTPIAKVVRNVNFGEAEPIAAID